MFLFKLKVDLLRSLYFRKMINEEYVRHENDLDVIKVNVGGQVFTTTRHTLTRSIPLHDQYFTTKSHSHLLQEIFILSDYDPKNLVFIDRNPRYFEYVLDFLRTSELDVDAFVFSITDDKKQRKLIIKEFEFFKIITSS